MMRTSDLREGHAYRYGGENVVVKRIFGRGRNRKVEWMAEDEGRRETRIAFFAADAEPVTADSTVCACGCGAGITSRDPKARFVAGHHRRGVAFTEEQKLKLSEGQKRAWAIRSPKVIVACPICGREFERSKNRKRFCSPECHSESQRAEKACHICGMPTRRGSGGDHLATCSDECRKASLRAAGEAKTKYPRTPRNCNCCGVEFTPSKQGLRGATATICSHRCGTKWVMNLGEDGRDYVRRSGWPDTVTLTQAQLLNVLAALGLPTPARELAPLIRRSEDCVRASLSALIPLELVIRTNPGVYALGVAALQLLENRAHEES